MRVVIVSPLQIAEVTAEVPVGVLNSVLFLMFIPPLHIRIGVDFCLPALAVVRKLPVIRPGSLAGELGQAWGQLLVKLGFLY